MLFRCSFFVTVARVDVHSWRCQATHVMIEK